MSSPDGFVYMLKDNTSARCYIGATVDPRRRLRQHRRELVGGARRTARGDWNMVLLIGGMDYHNALRLEWAFKNACRRHGYGLRARTAALAHVLARDRWTRASPLGRSLSLCIWTNCGYTSDPPPTCKLCIHNDQLFEMVPNTSGAWQVGQALVDFCSKG